MTELLEIKGQQLLLAFKVGARDVIKKTEKLNAINVFPVADGDTGSNLASLMREVLAVQASESETVSVICNRIGEAALIGSRGNSGIIFAQYLNGFAQHMPEKLAITIDDFIKGAHGAVESAYQSINNPTEGTMLSVMRDFANAIVMSKKTQSSLSNIITQSIAAAEVSVNNTPNQLKLLKLNAVVDSGALGFYTFIEGMSNALTNPDMMSEENLTVEPQLRLQEVETHRFAEAPTYRYCSEALLSNVNLSATEVKAAISDLGDSLVVATSQNSARIHIHTNTPERFFHQIATFGTVVDQKVDDMLLQYQVKQERKHRIALVTDSIADLPAEFILEQQIQVLPMNLLIDETSHLDKLTITSDYFYQRDLTARVSSSQPSLRLIENRFAYLKSYYEEVIVVTVAEKLSGTFSVIKKVAEEMSTPTFKIVMIDSKQNAVGQGLVVLQIADWIAAGKTLSEIEKLAEPLVANAEIFVSVDTVDGMIQSGRLPGRLGPLAKRLNLKPMIGLKADGGGTIKGIALSTKGSEKQLLKKIARLHRKQPITRYAIVHGNDAVRAQRMAALAEQQLGFKPAFIEEISTVVAMSAGEGAVAIGTTQGEKEEGNN